MKPEFQYGIESREPWLVEVLSLAGSMSGEGDNGVGETPERFKKILLNFKKHPAHDTAEWPPKAGLTC